MVDPEEDKPTIIALREIEEGLLDEENISSEDVSDTDAEILDNENDE